MTQLLDLLSLPTNVFSEVSSFVGSLEEFVRLDSAYCHHQFRETWLQLLASKNCVLYCPVDISEPDELSWAFKKSVRCSIVKFSLQIEAYKLVADFLRQNGDFIRTVEFGGVEKTQEMLLVAVYCTRLTCLRLIDATVCFAVRDIILRNPNLQRIFCIGVDCSEEDLLAGVSLHKLQWFSVSCTFSEMGFPWHETAFSDSLHTVLWDDCLFSVSELKALFDNCPRIRSFSVNDLDMFHIPISIWPVQLRNLSMSNNNILTDSQLLNIVSRLTWLRALYVQNCASLTDTIFQHLAEHAGDRLELLYADIKHPESTETETIFKVFSQKCTKLKYLNVDCGAKTLCSGKCFSALVHGCPQLQTLVVNKYSTIGRSSRALAGTLRPNLQILEHDNETKFDILSMPIN